MLSIGRRERILEALAPTDELRARRLRREDAPAAALAEAAGVHGVYVRNALDAGQAVGLVFELRGEVVVVAWFGPRGNLVLIRAVGASLSEELVADEVLKSRLTWRIALGDAGLVDALQRRRRHAVLTYRNQIYYAGVASDAAPELIRGDVRSPSISDRERLARATLALNASDLNIAPERVDRRWLHNTIDERIREGSTRVIGEAGALQAKLDFGSSGRGGVILEGVYTFPESRGRGFAAGLVATCMAASPVETSLHVAEDNLAARAAYERAGMREVGACRLLLLG